MSEMNKEEFKKCMDYLEQHRDEIIKDNEEARVYQEVEQKRQEMEPSRLKELIIKKRQKAKVIKEKSEIFFGDDLVLYALKDTELFFDNISFDLFNTEFLKEGEELIITDCQYLAKREKEDNGKRIIYFHRWLMSKELQKFASSISNNFEIVVHHMNEDTLDNRKSNLQIMTKEEHLKIHHRVS